MMTETPEQEAARLDSERLSRERLEAAQGTLPNAPQSQGKPDASPINASQMRGDRVPVQIGSLKLSLKPLTRKKMRQFQELIFGWPNVLQFAAAVRSPKCAGIDYEATAALMTAYVLSNHQSAEEAKAQDAVSKSQIYAPAPLPEPVTEQDVANEVTQLTSEIDAYDDDINAAVWLMAEGMEGVVYPVPEGAPEMPEGKTYLPDLLEEHLTIPQYADLLRAMKAANGGFAGDITQRTF